MIDNNTNVINNDNDQSMPFTVEPIDVQFNYAANQTPDSITQSIDRSPSMMGLLDNSTNAVAPAATDQHVCSICGRVLVGERRLQNHLIKAHNLQCPTCNIKFTYLDAFVRHLNRKGCRPQQQQQQQQQQHRQQQQQQQQHRRKQNLHIFSSQSSSTHFPAAGSRDQQQPAGGVSQSASFVRQMMERATNQYQSACRKCKQPMNGRDWRRHRCENQKFQLVKRRPFKCEWCHAFFNRQTQLDFHLKHEKRSQMCIFAEKTAKEQQRRQQEQSGTVTQQGSDATATSNGVGGQAQQQNQNIQSISPEKDPNVQAIVDSVGISAIGEQVRNTTQKEMEADTTDKKPDVLVLD